MSHTLHRRGDPETFKNDFIIFSMTAKGFNEKNSKWALKEFLRILHKYNISNTGDMKTGNMYIVDKEDIVDNVQDTSIVHAVFTNREEVKAALKELKEADLGVSVIVTGNVEEVNNICNEVGIKRHTVEYSVGIRGNLTRLPEEELLEITTMCGHGMVSHFLVRKMLTDIKKGRISIEEAAKHLATPCVCGVFNPQRAAMLLSELVEVWCLDEY